MLKNITTLFLFLLITISMGRKNSLLNQYSYCKPNEKTGTLCLLRVGQLRPTQLPYGRLEVICKVEKFEDYKKEKKLVEYLDTHPVPVVIGPHGQYFITDHHHLVKAYHDAQFTNFDYEKNPMLRPLVVQVVQNVNGTGMDQKTFWNWMEKNHYAYPLDQNGKPLNLTTGLPGNITGLVNDPFRSLSYVVRSYGAYGKNAQSVFFLEFVWADFLRQSGDFSKLEQSATLSWKVEEAQLEKAFKHAMKLCTSSAAKDLPGYGEGQVDIPKCKMWSNL
jgi:hypothetical protein